MKRILASTLMVAMSWLIVGSFTAFHAWLVAYFLLVAPIGWFP